MDSSKLYVGNLPFTATAQDLEALFAQVGTVSVVEIVFDRFTGRSRGFAFVTMSGPTEAQKAITQLHGHDISGRAMSVTLARPREDRTPRADDGEPGRNERRGPGANRGGPRRFTGFGRGRG
jgi:RNA recognition motif-containing protein